MTEIEVNNEVADALQVDNVSKLTYFIMSSNNFWIWYWFGYVFL
jgi:hypothetical protein